MEDDVLINSMLGTSGRLHDVVYNAVEYLNNTEHNGTLDLLRSNMCTLMQETVLEALDIMVRTGDIHCSSNHQLALLPNVYAQETTGSDKMRSVCYR